MTAKDVAAVEEGLRLDRWFRRHYPQVGFGRLAKLLRTGQIRVDGKRAKPGQRLVAGQTVRVPPLEEPVAMPSGRQPTPVIATEEDARALRDAVLYRDDDILVINKPSGLAVQGGSGTRRHLDGMLDALRFEADERPRLVHRLDKDTSGVLVLARTAPMAARLASLFRGRDVEKTYWALVAGVPNPPRGEISVALAKRPGRGGEKMMADTEMGRPAVTDYAIAETVGGRMTWLILHPRTGRTHQLRAHCLVLGTPIVGDGKYGGAGAFIDGVANRLHLHARKISFRHPVTGERVSVVAPLTGHMAETWKFLGFDPNSTPEHR